LKQQKATVTKPATVTHSSKKQQQSLAVTKGNKINWEQQKATIIIGSTKQQQSLAVTKISNNQLAVTEKQQSTGSNKNSDKTRNNHRWQKKTSTNN